MNILVTGGAGYIGSHTAKALAAAGHVPVVYDNMQKGHRWAVRYGPLVEAGLADRFLLQQAFRFQKIDAVIHFAGSICVGESMSDPSGYIRNNFINTLNLLDVMVEIGVRNIVFSSTCAIYGAPRQVPIPEDHPQDPVSPYGESKRMVERAMRWYGQAYGLRYVLLRYFNASGADVGGEIGEDHAPETHLIPLAMLAALGKAPSLSLFGTDYETPDGTAVRDYIHVSDLAEAHLAAMRYLQQGGEPGAFNLGNGRGATVREVLAAVERVSGLRVPVRECPRREGDAPVLIADARKAAAVLGWRPRMPELDVIVETAWRWHHSRAEAAG